MSMLSIKAGAKINLTLDITGKREDGYHLLQMVMQSVSLYDTISLEPAEEGGISFFCDRPEVPTGSSNTVIRAAEKFLSHCGLDTPNLKLRLVSRIPAQAGLGGGSTDAAGTILLLDRFFRTNLPQQELCAIGLSVGADVPFCLSGGIQLVEGIGERLTPLSAMPDCSIVICKPNCGISTIEAYRKSDETQIGCRPNLPAVVAALETRRLEQLGECLCNVFEEVEKLEEVAAIKHEMLRFQACGACMTGSGSAVYGLFADAAQAAGCAESLKKQYGDVFVCAPTAKSCIFE